MFEKYDKNGRGKLDRFQLTEMVRELSAKKRRKKLSEEEVSEYVEFIMKKADTDREGYVTKR